MYSMGAYFVEVIPLPIAGKGWSAEARFSRQADYRKHAEVLKVSYPSQLVRPTRMLAEWAAAQWASEFVRTDAEVIESSLRILEEMTNAGTVRRVDPAH